MQKSKLITTSILAKRLGFTPTYVRQLCASGKIKAEKYGHDWIINEKDIKNLKRIRITKKGQVI